MTYNEWRDELKSNLLTVSEKEKKRVLDYYAEAYADRRDAGYSEEHIINDFGAPYDAAQRILLNIYDNDCDYVSSDSENVNVEIVKGENKQKRKGNKVVQAEVVTNETRTPQTPQKNRSVVGIIIGVLLSLVGMFAIATLIIALSGMFLAPIGCILGSVITIIFGFIDLASNIHSGVYSIGEGIMVFGIGLILIPICVKLIKIFVNWLKKLFKWTAELLNGKEYIK